MLKNKCDIIKLVITLVFMKLGLFKRYFYTGLFLCLGAVLATACYLFFQSSETLVVDQDSNSVELGLLELSPLGEAGGYAMPASGCSVIHRDCTGGYGCTGKDCTPVCQGWGPRYVNSCSISTDLRTRKYADGSWSGYSVNDRNMVNGNSIQVNWSTSLSDPGDNSRIVCTQENFSDGGLSGNNINVVEPTAGNSTNYRVVCSYYNRSSASAVRVTNISPLAVNGSCGTANGRTFSHTDTSYGSYTACSAGSASGFSFPAAGSSDSWTCSGSNGGAPASCSASRSAVPADDDLTPDEPTIDGVIPTTVNTRIPVGTAASLYTVQRNIGNANSATYRLRFYVDQPVSSAINAGGIFDNQGALAPNGNRPHPRTWTPTETGVHAIRVETENSGTWTQYNQDTDLAANNDDSSTYSFWVIPQPVDDLTYTCSADGSQITFNWTAPAGTVGNTFAWRFDNITQGGWTNTCSSINPGDECLDITSTSRTVNISPGDSVSAWVHARGNDSVWGASDSTGTFTCGQSDLDPNNPLFNGSNPNGQDYRIGTPITISSIQQNKGGVTSGQYRFRFLVDQPISANIAPGGNLDGQGPIIAGGTNSHSTTWTPTELGVHTVSAQTFANGSFGTYVDSDTSNNNSAALSFNIVPVPECIDGSDNDNDGLTDSADPDCPGGGADGCSSPPCNEGTNDTPVDADIEVCLLGDTGGSSCTPDTLSIVGVDEVEISWDSTFASNCTFTNFDGGGLTGSASRNGTDDTIAEPSDSSRTYTVTCIDSSDGTSISDSVIVSHAASGSTDACVPPYDISADPRVVRSGTNSTISFTNYNEATGCTLHQNDITNPAVSTSGTRSCGVPTTYTAGPLTSASTYVLNCPDDPGPTRPTVTIPVIPVIDDN